MPPQNKKQERGKENKRKKSTWLKEWGFMRD
jgi:hypothetical protein